MNKSKLFLFLAVLFSGLSCACTQPKTAGESPITQTEGKITFSSSLKVGERYTTKSKAELIVDGDASTKSALVSIEKHELIKSENGLNTWKTITTFKPENVAKGVTFSEGSGFRENRITLSTYNEYGNLVSEEGGEPGDEQFYKGMPETPVKIGDSWIGYSTNGKTEVKNYYTLEAIEMLNGIECAVVTLKYERDSLSAVAKNWIGISTRITYKSQGTMKGLNDTGQKSELRFTSLVASR